MLKREKIYQKLAERIRQGIWQPGFKLPAEPVLCRELGVARITLRAALERLTAEGLLSRSRPAGTMVTLPEEGRKKILVTSGSKIMPEISRPELYIIPGIERRCLELNWDVEYSSFAFLPEELPENYLGVISLNSNFNGKEAIIGKLRALKVPVVNAHVFPGDPEKTRLPSVLTDFRSAYLAGLAHLSRMGHRKICFLMRPWPLAGQRLNIPKKEFPELLEKFQIDTDERFVIFLPENETDFSEELKALIFSEDPPTAIYAYSDYFALRSYELLKKWHVRIPEEMAVLGFSGYSAAALQSPPLSTVDFGYGRIGRIAVDMLRQQEKWFGKSTPVIFSPYDVITRQSTDFYRMNFSDHKAKTNKSP